MKTSLCFSETQAFRPTHELVELAMAQRSLQHDTLLQLLEQLERMLQTFARNQRHEQRLQHGLQTAIAWEPQHYDELNHPSMAKIPHLNATIVRASANLPHLVCRTVSTCDAESK
jgi:hypothetical protein